MSETTIYCAFYLISADLADPDEVTRRIGLQPTRTWREGDKVSPSTITRKKNSGWELSTPVLECIDVNEPLSQLLSILEPLAGRIAEVRGELHLEAIVSCILCVESVRPAIYFDAKAVQLIASLGAEIDIDIVYWIGPDEPTE